ncbi:hypothetical protein DDI_0098 [Dickeya dianthicola RNS04.9]|nr:hypothetical protein DDI_0098 [Dickeya dianthicola RNS04.9]
MFKKLAYFYPMSHAVAEAVRIVPQVVSLFTASRCRDALSWFKTDDY